MNYGDLFREITATYQKFGWTLRRVLLTKDARRELLTQPQNSIFAKVAIEDSDFNALWFSRMSSDKRETWELRLLSASRFALLEIFEKTTPDFERERRQEIMLEKLKMNAPKFKV